MNFLQMGYFQKYLQSSHHFSSASLLFSHKKKTKSKLVDFAEF